MFDLTDFTAADTLARFQAYVAATVNGLMNPNECRARENLPPYEGGDEFHRPLNTGKAAPGPGNAAPAGAAGRDARHARATRASHQSNANDGARPHLAVEPRPA